MKRSASRLTVILKADGQTIILNLGPDRQLAARPAAELLRGYIRND